MTHSAPAGTAGSPAAPVGERLVYGAAAALLCLVIGVRATASYDLYFHMSIGRAALEGRGLSQDVFSYAADGVLPWRYKDLVAAVLLYAGYQRLSFAWFALLKGLCAAGLATALYLAPRRDERGGAAWLVGLCGLLLAVQYRIVERPLLFSMVGFALMLALIDRARRQIAPGPAPTPTGRMLVRAALPLLGLQWAWAQLHREALVGLVLLGGLAAYLGLGFLLGRVPLGQAPWARALWRVRPGGAWVLWALGLWVTAMGLCLVNPSGVALYQTSVSLAGSDLFRHLLSEWQPLGLVGLCQDFPAAVLLCVLALGLLLHHLVAADATRDLDAWHLGALLLFTGLSTTTIRWVPFAATTAAVILVQLAPGWGQRLLSRVSQTGQTDQADQPGQPGQAGQPGRTAPRGAAVLLGLLSVVLLYQRSARSFRPGLGEQPDRFPAGALSFARAHGLSARVANAFPLGGYVMFHGAGRFQVLVDGRTETVYRPEHVADCLLSEHDPVRFAAARARDGADWVLAQNKAGEPSHEFLLSDSAWMLVYWSEPALIYVRRDRYPQLQAQQLRRVPDLLFREGAQIAAAMAAMARAPALREELLAELLRLVEASPDGVRSNTLLALFYEILAEAGGPDAGRYRERRAQVLGHLLEARGDHPALGDP